MFSFVSSGVFTCVLVKRKGKEISRSNQDRLTVFFGTFVTPGLSRLIEDRRRWAGSSCFSIGQIRKEKTTNPPPKKKEWKNKPKWKSKGKQRNETKNLAAESPSIHVIFLRSVRRILLWCPFYRSAAVLPSFFFFTE